MPVSSHIADGPGHDVAGPRVFADIAGIPDAAQVPAVHAGTDLSAPPVLPSLTMARDEQRAHADEQYRLATAKRWIGEFLTRHDPRLGRDGDVCPFVSRSLGRGLLSIESFDAAAGDQALRDRVRGLRDALLEESASAGDDRMYLASVIVPYGRPDRMITRQIERVQSVVKPEFVSRGMMIGEFWPDHEMPGLHNQSFRPLACPVPMLAMRYMVVTDLLFLSGPHIPPVTRVSLLADYERNLGPGLTDRWRARCHEAMAAAAQAAREAGRAAENATGQAI